MADLLTASQHIANLADRHISIGTYPYNMLAISKQATPMIAYMAILLRLRGSGQSQHSLRYRFTPPQSAAFGYPDVLSSGYVNHDASSDMLTELLKASHNLVVYRSLLEDPDLDDVFIWLLNHATDPVYMDGVVTRTPLAQDAPLEALESGDEPLQSRIAVYQREAAACLAYLQQHAFSSPRTAAIAHQWFYKCHLGFEPGTKHQSLRTWRHSPWD